MKNEDIKRWWKFRKLYNKINDLNIGNNNNNNSLSLINIDSLNNERKMIKI